VETPAVPNSVEKVSDCEHEGAVGLSGDGEKENAVWRWNEVESFDFMQPQFHFTILARTSIIVAFNFLRIEQVGEANGFFRIDVFAD
jgi:hypothetical protein